MLTAAMDFVKERFYLRRSTWARLQANLPAPVYRAARTAATPWDGVATLRFLTRRDLPLPPSERLSWVRRFRAISAAVDSPHEEGELLQYTAALLRMPADLPGCLVEAGCYKGGSAAKISIVARHLGRELVLFDSFEGLPAVEENHRTSVFGRAVAFKQGDWCGTLDEVKRNITSHGEPSACRFVQGWFEDTMPAFDKPIAAMYVDVDLASSTRTCLRHLYPLTSPGGLVYAQDGHLPLVLEVYEDAVFWADVLGQPPPRIEGLRKRTLIHFTKPPAGGKP